MQRTKPFPSQTRFPNRLPDAICGSPSVEFTQISNKILRDPNLSLKAKGLLALSLSNKSGKWISYVQGMQSYCTEGPDAIRSGLKELEEAGYLLRLTYVDKKTKRRRGSFWVYTHFPFHFDIKEHIKTLEINGLELQNKQGIPENPYMENPYMENPYMENPALRILNNKNTNNKNTKKEGKAQLILENFSNGWEVEQNFIEAVEQYCIHRKEINKPVTPQASKMLATKLKKYPQWIAIKALLRSVENGWTGVFPESISNNGKQPKPERTTSYVNYRNKE